MQYKSINNLVRQGFWNANPSDERYIPPMSIVWILEQNRDLTGPFVAVDPVNRTLLNPVIDKHFTANEDDIPFVNVSALQCNCTTWDKTVIEECSVDEFLKAR